MTDESRVSADQVLNLVDSSGWLAYFADDPNASFFAPAIEDADHLVVPTISLYEVFKRLRQLRGEGTALQAVAAMHRGEVINLDDTLALRAAEVSLRLSLPMADSMILATAQAYGATLWTQDIDFQHVQGVRYIAKAPTRAKGNS